MQTFEKGLDQSVNILKQQTGFVCFSKSVHPFLIHLRQKCLWRVTSAQVFCTSGILCMQYGRALSALIGLNGPDQSLRGPYLHTLPIFHSEEQKMVFGTSVLSIHLRQEVI